MQTEYYTTYNHLLHLFDTAERKYALTAKDRQSYFAWKDQLQNTLKHITGLGKMQPGELLQKQLESRKMEGFRRDKYIIQTEPDVWMPFYMLVPEGLEHGEKRAAVIAPHGHCGAGKESVAGNRENPTAKKAIERYHYDYGVQLVKAGYVVLCPDARGSGERREWMDQGESEEKQYVSSCTALNHAAMSLGQSLAGMWTFDLMRLIDFIEECTICDSGRIGCCGFSGGGLQTIWLSCLDDRIHCAYVSGYFHSFRDALLKTNSCGCNFVPGLWDTAELGDIAALIAPRGLFIESGSFDSLHGERGIVDVKEQVAITQRAYQLLGVPDNLHHHVFDGEHQWDGEKLVWFFNKYL